jgi:DNA-directed RNA polymerase III subunit RPC6
MASLADLILSVCSAQGKVTHAELTQLLALHGSFSDAEIVGTTNQLIIEGRVFPLSEKNQVVYQLQSEDQASAFQALSSEERLVLQIVRESGNLGIWNLDIKVKTGIPTQHVNRILKSLEIQGQVKCVKSMQHKNRKVWMLSEIEPSTDTVGNFLYQESQEFDNDWLQSMIHHAKAFLLEQVAGVKELTLHLKHVTGKGLTEENVKEVVGLMIALQQIEQMAPGKYRAVKWTVPEPPPVPCILCPLARECQEDALISPKSCKYLAAWLSL